MFENATSYCIASATYSSCHNLTSFFQILLTLDTFHFAQDWSLGSVLLTVNYILKKLHHIEAVAWRCSVKKDVLRNFTKFTGKHLRHSLFFNKVASLRHATLLKKRLWHRCFPMNFAKSLKTTFFTEHLRRLLLIINVWQCSKYTSTIIFEYLIDWRLKLEYKVHCAIWSCSRPLGDAT